MPHPFKAWMLEPVTPKNSVRLTALFLIASCAVSVALLRVRNIFDDEYSNFHYLSMPISQVIRTANTTDVHPPGMYLLTWAAYHLVPSPRWMNIFPLFILYVALGFFCFRIAPSSRTKGSMLCFLLLATLHPQLIMWGGTVRWYSWWTGIALVTVTFALESGRAVGEFFSFSRATVLGFLLIALFYINYITFIFFAALMLTMFYRYGCDIWKQLVLTSALFVTGIGPQLHAFFTVHARNSSRQSAGALLSLARILEATFSSEAYLPWHPLAVAIFLLLTALLAVGAFRLAKGRFAGGQPALQDPEQRCLASFVVFALFFLILVGVCGFGVKPRNGLLLAPLLAIPVALLVRSIRWPLQVAIPILLVLWTTNGVEHLLTRKGLAKSNMINRPEEVASYIRSSQEGNCNLVVTYDSLLTLTLASSGLPRMSVLTPEAFPLPIRLEPWHAAQCPLVNVYVVRSSLNDITGANEIAAEMNRAIDLLPSARTAHLSLDPDAAIKRRLAAHLGGEDVPDYRYVVISAQLSWPRTLLLEGQLHHFASANGSLHE